jgi:hypothetical protein
VRLTAYRTCSRGSPFPSTHSFARKKSGKYQVIKMAAQHGVSKRAPVARKAREIEQRSLGKRGNAKLSRRPEQRMLISRPSTICYRPSGRRAKVTMFVAPYLKYRVRVSQTVAGEQNQGLSAAMPRRGLARAAASAPTPQFKTIQLGLNDRPATLW